MYTTPNPRETHMARRILTAIRPTNPALHGRGFGLCLDGRIEDDEARERYRSFVQHQLVGYQQALADLDAGRVAIQRGSAGEVN